MAKTAMHYVYGPIPSRRLGRSLGIDPIPLKTCNWNCVYCQLGRTRPLTNERRQYVPREMILAEIQEVLVRHVGDDIDFVSFVGSGEPTLHSELGWLIRQLKAFTGIPIAVITNGALLYLPEVRADLLPADVVMPTLCAGTPALYQRIHRPHPDVSFARIVEGLIAFRQEYHGRLWVELMLLHDINDTAEALQDLAAVIRRVQPDEVHVIVPDRPPAELWVKPPDDEGLMRAAAILGPIAHIVHPYTVEVDVSDYATPVEAILGIVTRHPMSRQQLVRVLDHWSAGEIDGALAELVQREQAHRVERLGTQFWTAAPAYFPMNGKP